MKTKTIAASLIFAVTALFAGFNAAQDSPPETPALRLLTLWLETFNDGDRAAREQFVREHWPSKPNPNVDQDLAFREQTGGFDLLRIEEATATHAVALVQERNSDTVGRMVVDVTAAQTPHIVNLGIRAIPRPADLAIPRLTEAELVSALGTELETRAAADRFSGAVLVAKDGEAIFAGAYGLANRAERVSNRLDTQFRNGSMNKMFTATAVLTLVQAGKLALDDPLGKYLTDYPNATVASAVTIHHLLTHTGGTGDIFGPDFTAHRLELRNHEDYVKLFGARDLLFAPGSQWRYSNYGFVLLGAVIEKASGETYYDYVRKHVYEPAGMTSTASAPEAEVVANRAVGYMREPGSTERQPNTDTLPYRGMAAGGGYTTVADLLKFANALENHTLLNAEHTDLLLTGKVQAGAGMYAYGFSERIIDGARAVGHNGGAPGQNGDLTIFPDSGYVVAVLSNFDPPAAQRVADFVSNRLPR